METVRIERNQLLEVLSEVLDRVEGEVLGVTSHHAKRVAWMCLQLAQKAGMPVEERSDLAVAALMHDGALNEFRNDYEGGSRRKGKSGQGHCAAGEENLQMIPGCRAARGFVLYHHESADGSGPFGKREEDTPFGAQMIHLANEVDTYFSPGNGREKTVETVCAFVRDGEGKSFGTKVSRLFFDTFRETWLTSLSDENIEQLTLDIPPVWIEVSDGENAVEGSGRAGLYSLAKLFARIIDYKSPFTKEHSVGIAAKAAQMADYYGFDAATRAKFYFAGALHDIGKIMVDRDVLEKPGKLDALEYTHIKTHAYETWRLLTKLEGMHDVTIWAALHHEKLNGKGYPFGKTAEELGHKERILACLDIYQALTEDRPYKAGMSHRKAMNILREMADNGELDGVIIADMEKVFGGDYREGAEQEAEKTALFACGICGYIYEGTVIPEGYICPVCGQPETAFVRIL